MRSTRRKDPEEPVEDLRSAGHQDVGMSALRDTAPMFAGSRESVAVDQRDSGVRLRQYARGEQPSHASAENHRMITDLAHLANLQGLRRR
jgi:hypothetical protein